MEGLSKSIKSMILGAGRGQDPAVFDHGPKSIKKSIKCMEGLSKSIKSMILGAGRGQHPADFDQAGQARPGEIFVEVIVNYSVIVNLFYTSLFLNTSCMKL